VENTFDQPVAINNTPFEIDKLEARIGLSLPFDFTNGRTIKRPEHRYKLCVRAAKF
jgi:hypothetical protein